MTKPKGGRGYKAPYQTHQVRVPDPIATQVHSLIERYQDYIADGGNPNSPPQLLDVHKPIDDLSNKLEEEVRILEEKLKAVDKFKSRVASILREALKLKANAGGAIKKEIEKALDLLN